MSLVITGSPGTGKHAVAGIMAEKRGLDIIDLNREAGAQGEVDTEALAAAVAGRAGPGTLVVGHLAPYVLVPGQVGGAVVMRRSPYELEQIYRDRGYPESKTIENQAAEILGVVAHDAAAGLGRIVQVDSTGRTAEESAAAAEEALAAGGGGGPDWLGLVESRGELGRFFPTD